MESLSGEFKGLYLGDKRLHTRCFGILQTVSANPALSFPKMSENWGRLKGLYRFFDNKKVTREKIMEPHVLNTVQRCLDTDVVLAVQDSTLLNYSHHLSAEGLAPMFSSGEGGWGMMVHSVFAVNGRTKEPLGILHQEVIVRETRYPREESYRQRLSRPRESEKWTTGLRKVKTLLPSHPKIIHIGDREADIYLFIKEILASEEGFVIRCTRNRSLAEGYLFETVQQGDLKGSTSIPIPRNGNRPGRVATVEIRACAVKMLAPNVVRHIGTIIPVNAMMIQETKAPSGQEPLHWILLTSEPIEREEDCLTVMRYYQSRWMIEEYHKGLKTGCKIEDRQLSSKQQLENVLGLFTVMVIRLLYLRFLAKQSLAPSEKHGLTEFQIKIIRHKYPKECKDLNPATLLVLIARMGGFIGRKSDGTPGWLTLMRGMHDLFMIEQGMLLANQLVGKG
jgi:hypothetical protein